MPIWKVVVGYLCLLAAMVGLAGILVLVGIDEMRATVWAASAVCFAAALQKPRIVYHVIRNTSWFVLIPGPLLRGYLGGLGLLCVAAALLG